MTHLLLRKLFVVAALSLFIIFPELGSGWFRFGRQVIDRIARRPFLAMTAVAFVSLSLSTGLGVLVRMPQPYAHDEFSYLLAGDTFARGRLTNPTHPMWEHFETFHVIQQPTYASKYPPGQGLTLALGQRLSGYPIVGVWISTALACVAVCWMMYGWLPAPWALMGALLTALHPVVVEWSQCYWGGSVALAGGALVLGALGRILRQARSNYGVVMACGMTILANSRPYEGMVLSSLVVAVLLWRLITRQLPLNRLASIASRGLVILLLAGAAMAFYNSQVTGYPWRLPYLVHEASYAVTPLFLWQRPRPEPPYRHQALRDFHVAIEIGAYRQQTESVGSWLHSTWDKYSELTVTHFPTSVRYLILAIVVVAAPVVIPKDAALGLMFVLLIGFIIGTLPEIFMSRRYTAPAFSLLFVFVLRLLRYVRLWAWHGRPLGRSVVRVCLIACVVGFILTIVRGFTTAPEGLDLQWWGANRAAIVERLSKNGGQHLIMVRYGRRHSPHQEWVYNEADIDRSKVVWAREMDPLHNRALLTYFGDRQIWLLAVDDDTEAPRLVPYQE